MGSYSKNWLVRISKPAVSPVPMYPLFPMENPTASCRPMGKLDFCIQLLFVVSYCHNSFEKSPGCDAPVAIYPMLPMENPTDSQEYSPAKVAFLFHKYCPCDNP